MSAYGKPKLSGWSSTAIYETGQGDMQWFGFEKIVAYRKTGDDSDSEGLTGDRTGGDMGDYLGTENDGMNQGSIAGNGKNDEKDWYADSDIPKTGNAIPLLLWSFLLTGAMLIVMTCYRFRMAVKHENQ